MRRKITQVDATTDDTAIDMEALMARFDTPDAEYFALVTQSVDRHRLRVFDTHSGVVANEIYADKDANFTCLAWGRLKENRSVNGNGSAPPPRKKKRHSATQLEAYTKIIALGLQDGSIAIFSVADGSVIKKLTGSHTLPVNDFVFVKNGRKGYSCAEDLTIVEWDICEGCEISKWKADAKPTRKLALSHDETKLISAGHTIKLWDLRTKQVLKMLTGHASLITDLKFSIKDEVCVSAAEHDRFVNIWDCRSELNDDKNLSALTLDANVSSLSISSCNSLLAVTQEGKVAVFQDVVSQFVASGTKPKKSKKRRYVTSTANCVVSVLEEDNSDVVIPILAACFADEELNNESGKVMIARGSTVKPIFEKVQIVSDKNGSFLREVTLRRRQPSGFLMDESNLTTAKLKVSQKRYDDSQATILGTADFAVPDERPADKDEGNANQRDAQSDDESIRGSKKRSKQKKGVEAKFGDFVSQAASAPNGIADLSTKTLTKEGFRIANTDSLREVLVQALHSNDDELLNMCLDQTNPELIRNTIIKLPPKHVVTFLEKTVDRFQANPNVNMSLMEWIKAVLLIHTAYLMTVPDLVRKLSHFYEILDNRLAVFPKLLSFYGRLDLASQQISMRRAFTKAASTETETGVYIEDEEEAEDSPDMMEGKRIHEDDEDDEESDEESDGESAEGSLQSDELSDEVMAGSDQEGSDQNEDDEDISGPVRDSEDTQDDDDDDDDDIVEVASPSESGDSWSEASEMSSS